jgi:outer membrane protein assembly factor BamB
VTIFTTAIRYDTKKEKRGEPPIMTERDKKKRRLFLFLILVLILAVGGLLVGRRIWFAIQGDERLHGPQETIPEGVKVITPLEKGEADWPSWRGPNGDGKSSVIGIKKDWSEGLTKLWQVNFLCQGDRNVTWSAPVVRGNRLVVPGRDNKNDLVFCLDPKNGEVIWVGSYEAETGANHGPGARATPFIDEDRVYTFGRSGDLVCWKLEDGQLVWRQNVKKEGGEEPTWGHSSSPLVYQDKVIVQGGGKALVIAYDKMTGNVIWKSMEGKAGYAAIMLIETGEAEKLLVFYGTGLTCLEPSDGREIWSVLWETDYDVNATTPVTSGSTVFITSGYNTGCEAFKVEDTRVEPLWRSKVIASHHSDPVIIDGYIYGYSGQSNQNKGQFKCVELESGEEKWRTGEIGWGTTVYVDGHLLCMDIKGNLFLVKPVPNGLNKVAELRDTLGDVSHAAWTIPVIANGKLYLRYMQRLHCYDLIRR